MTNHNTQLAELADLKPHEICTCSTHEEKVMFQTMQKMKIAIVCPLLWTLSVSLILHTGGMYIHNTHYLCIQRLVCMV